MIYQIIGPYRFRETAKTPEDARLLAQCYSLADFGLHIWTVTGSDLREQYQDGRQLERTT